MIGAISPDEPHPSAAALSRAGWLMAPPLPIVEGSNENLDHTVVTGPRAVKCDSEAGQQPNLIGVVAGPQSINATNDQQFESVCA
jgi:hypothetical protein